MVLKDKDIREPLFEFLEERYAKVRILEEQTIGDSRADIMMILPDRIIGIEIKSDADTYARLERQVKDYELYFDANMVVVGSTHAIHVSEHIPDHWGIISVEEIDETLDFYVVREMKPNPNRELKRKIRILWRPELAHIQELNMMAKYKEKSKDFVRKKIIEKVPEEILHKQISDELFERDYDKIAEQIKAYRQAQNPTKRVHIKKKKYRRKNRK